MVIAADREDPRDKCDLGGKHQHLTLDVSDAEQVKAALAPIGPLHGAVNAAGISMPGSIHQLDLDVWRKVIDINLTGTMLICRQVTDAMVAANIKGSVVNLSSVYGITGGPGNISYNVSKSGVWQLTRCMAADLGSLGIRVNAVSPGYIETPMTDMLKHADAFREHFVAMHLLKRPGQPEEVAAAICFLLSDDAAYITGVNLPVDGGFTAAHVPIVSM